MKIFYKGSFHWITESNINCENNEINYYDRKYNGKIKDHIRMQVCNFCKYPKDEVASKARVCQQQTNVADCGWCLYCCKCFLFITKRRY